MPRTPKKKDAAMPDFEAQANALRKTPEGKEALLTMAVYFCCLLDAVTSDADTWFNVGLSRATLCPLLTLHEGKVITYAGGRDLDGFLGEFLGL